MRWCARWPGCLHDTYGVRRGDRVAVAMRNYPEWVISYWAIISLGAACVGLNAWWTAAEMEYGLSDSRPRVVIVDGERLARLAPILEGLRAGGPMSVIAARADGEALPDDTVRWADVVTIDGAPATLPDAEIDPDDDACIFYTSGTTGFPKGAQLTHRGCVTNLMNIAFMAAAAQAADAAVAATAGGPGPAPAPSAPAFMAATPLFHVTANNCVLYPATLVGGKLVLMHRWDVARAIELIERERITNFAGVPSMGRELITHPNWATSDTSSVVGLSGGGAPVPPDQVDKIADKVNDRAPTTGYGLTETTGIVTANYGGSYRRKPASCGPVVPTLDAKLVDEAGNDLAPSPDVTGELCVRGSIVIKGYLNRPEDTARGDPRRMVPYR
jgi:long-chain acyl-CoA synthetase